MPSFEFKTIRQDVYIIIGFAALSLLFCYPQLQGKKLIQGDNISWQAMAREAMAYHDSTGKDVLWSNSMFGGMPTYTTYVAATSHNYPAYIQTILEAIGKPAYFFFIAMIAFYILMRVLNVNKWLSAIGGIAYAFSSFNAVIVMVGHETQMLSLAYLPAVLAGFFLLYKGKWWTGTPLFAIGVSLMAANNHFQVMYYTIITLFAAGIGLLFVAIKEKKIGTFIIASVISIAAGLIGASTNMASILTTKEYAKTSMRGGESELSEHDVKTNGGLDKEYAFRWSNSFSETFSIMIPYLYGGSDNEDADKAPKTAEATGQDEHLPLYWGPQPFVQGPVYFGAAICFLFVLGLLVIRSPHKWWISGVILLSLFMSWGKYFSSFNYFLFDHLPLLNKFRNPSMMLVIPELLFPVIAIWGIQQIMDRKNTDSAEIWKNVKIAAGITAGLCILLGPLGSIFFSYTGGEDPQLQPQLVSLLKDDRSALATKSGLMSAFYILVCAGLVWAYVKDKLKTPWFFGALAALIAIDMIPVCAHYLGSDKYQELPDYAAYFDAEVTQRGCKEAYTMILRDKDPYFRVFDFSEQNPYNDAVQAYYFKCVGGYHPAKMEAYQDLIDKQLSNGFNTQVLSMLNTKYIIVRTGQKSPASIMPNPNACGNAWFVNEIKWVNTADEEMTSLNASKLGDTAKMPGEFEPLKTAVIRANFKNQLSNYNFGKDSSAYIRLTQYGLDDISFASDNKTDGLGVFSDIYYPFGWHAYVDGKETPIIRTDYVLRAIKIPAGQHKIEFHFNPESFQTGNRIALMGSLFLIAICGGAIFRASRKSKAGGESKA